MRGANTEIQKYIKNLGAGIDGIHGEGTVKFITRTIYRKSVYCTDIK